MDPTKQHETYEQLHLFDPATLDPWKVACGRLLRVGRRGPLPTSLGELGQLTGLPPAQLRESEKLAERQEAA